MAFLSQTSMRGAQCGRRVKAAHVVTEFALHRLGVPWWRVPQRVELGAAEGAGIGSNRTVVGPAKTTLGSPRKSFFPCRILVNILVKIKKTEKIRKQIKEFQDSTRAPGAERAGSLHLLDHDGGCQKRWGGRSITIPPSPPPSPSPRPPPRPPPPVFLAS